jgi:hypothetical protein
MLDYVRTAAGLCVVTVMSALAGRLLVEPARFRLVLAGSVGAVLTAVGLRRPRWLLYALMVWLPMLGLTRRLATTVGPSQGHDVLLLVGPIALVVLTAAAAGRGAFGRLTPLANIVLVLSGLFVLGAFNPLQGSLLTGVAGILFVFPLLAFWIGRGLCDARTLTRALGLVAALAIPFAIYGLLQTLHGFPSWDQAYINAHPDSLPPVNGIVRPFSVLTSASEYVTYLGCAAVIWLGFSFGRMRLAFTLAVLALLGTAAVYESSRGALFVFALAFALMLAARARLPMPISLTAAALLVVAVPLIAGMFTPPSGTSPSATLISHEVQGLSNPLDPQSSSLNIHINSLKTGFQALPTHPLGYGSGAITIAGAKFGGLSFGTEVDPGNISIALGIPGLIAYLLFTVYAFRLLYELAARQRDRLALVALGLFSLTVLQWFNGGLYAIAPLAWLVLGWADRRVLDERERAADAAA